MPKADQQLETPKVGQRIRVVEPYYFDPYPNCVPKDAKGEVVKVEIEKGEVQPTIHIKTEGDGYNLEDGIMPFYPQCGPQEEAGPGPADTTILRWFHYHCRIVG